MATEDRTVQPELQRFVAKRMGATTVELGSSHVPMLGPPLDPYGAAAENNLSSYLSPQIHGSTDPPEATSIAFCAPVSIMPLWSSPVILDLIDRVDAARRKG